MTHSTDLPTSNTRAAYDRVAGRYVDDTGEEDDPRLRRMCRALFIERLSGRRILEVGCGPALDSAKLKRQGLQVVGSDLSHGMLTQARRLNPDVPLAQMDMRAPCFSTGSFDGIFGAATFIHLPRARSLDVLAAFRRVLRPGGLVFLTLITSSSVDEYTIEDWGGVPDNPLHFVCWDPDEMSVLLSQAGFERIETFAVRSVLYERMPRLAQRGVTGWQLCARRSGSSPDGSSPAEA